MRLRHLLFVGILFLSGFTTVAVAKYFYYEFSGDLEKGWGPTEIMTQLFEHYDTLNCMVEDREKYCDIIWYNEPKKKVSYAVKIDFTQSGYRTHSNGIIETIPSSFYMELLTKPAIINCIQNPYCDGHDIVSYNYVEWEPDPFHTQVFFAAGPECSHLEGQFVLSSNDPITAMWQSYNVSQLIYSCTGEQASIGVTICGNLVSYSLSIERAYDKNSPDTLSQIKCRTMSDSVHVFTIARDSNGTYLEPVDGLEWFSTSSDIGIEKGINLFGEAIIYPKAENGEGVVYCKDPNGQISDSVFVKNDITAVHYQKFISQTENKAATNYYNLRGQQVRTITKNQVNIAVSGGEKKIQLSPFVKTK